MKLNNVCTMFVSGESIETTLFKCALYWAELGEPVWFISPEQFKSLPSGWTKPPDKEILKLIYFIYLPETKDLLTKLCDVHLLPKLPKIIIIMDLDHYLFAKNDTINLTNAAFVVSCLLDAASVFATKFSSSSFLISSCKNIASQKLQTIIDLYYLFNFTIPYNTCKEIEDIFNNYNNS